MSIKSITPAGDWLYFGVFEPLLVIACAPGPAGRGGGRRTLTSLQPPQGQYVFEHNHQQVSDLVAPGPASHRSHLSSPSHLRRSVTSSIPPPPSGVVVHAVAPFNFPKFLTTLVSADSAIVKQMISLLCQNNPNLVERKGGRIKMTKGGGYFHLVINVQMSTKAESDTTF